MSKYRKFYVAFAGFLAVVAQVTTDGAISAEDVGLLATALVTALAVFGVPNTVKIPAEAVDAIAVADDAARAADPLFSEKPFWADGRDLND